MDKVVDVISEDMKTLTKSRFKKVFLSERDRIHEMIMDQYNEKLVDVVANNESLIDPTFYSDLFSSRLYDFEFIDEDGDSVIINSPDINSFDFSNGLEPIEFILEGVVGEYVEISDDDYLSVFNALPQVNDDMISFPEGVHLIKNSITINKLENILNKKFTIYPFSNMPPIDIFSDAESFIDSNLDKWIDIAIKEADRLLVKKYEGATV